MFTWLYLRGSELLLRRSYFEYLQKRMGEIKMGDMGIDKWYKKMEDHRKKGDRIIQYHKIPKVEKIWVNSFMLKSTENLLL